MLRIGLKQGKFSGIWQDKGFDHFPRAVENVSDNLYYTGCMSFYDLRAHQFGTIIIFDLGGELFGVHFPAQLLEISAAKHFLMNIDEVRDNYTTGICAVIK